MTATNHSVTGIAIAVAINGPIALPLAFAAHFIEDAIPHSALGLKEVWLDLLFAIALTFGLAWFLKSEVSIWIVLASAFLCASPDLVWGWRYFRYKEIDKVVSQEPISWFSRWHQKIQWSETRQGAILEVFWLAGLLSFILIKR